MRRSSSRGGGGDGGGGGCSEGCWQHRLLSRCYIEWVDEYLRRSTSCGFFFNQANLRAPSFPTLRATWLFPILLRLVGFPLAQIMARSGSRAVYADKGRGRGRISRSWPLDETRSYLVAGDSIRRVSRCVFASRESIFRQSPFVIGSRRRREFSREIKERAFI